MKNTEVPDCLKELFRPSVRKSWTVRFVWIVSGRGISEAEIQEIERLLGIPLPHSFRSFLACVNGYILNRPVAQMHRDHVWKHPTGTICFANYFWEADGDQVVFDISQGLIDGEYPVLYYAHDFARQENKGLRRIARLLWRMVRRFGFNRLI